MRNRCNIGKIYPKTTWVEVLHPDVWWGRTGDPNRPVALGVNIYIIPNLTVPLGIHYYYYYYYSELPRESERLAVTQKPWRGHSTTNGCRRTTTNAFVFVAAWAPWTTIPILILLLWYNEYLLHDSSVVNR